MAILSNWKLIAAGAVAAAFLSLYIGFNMRGAEIDKLTQQIAFYEHISADRARRADDATKALAAYRKSAGPRKTVKATPQEAAEPVPTVIRRAIDDGLQQVY